MGVRKTVIRKNTIAASVSQDWAQKMGGEWNFIHSPSSFCIFASIYYFFFFRLCGAGTLPRLLCALRQCFDFFSALSTPANSSGVNLS